jgi:hypothetical protein
MKYNLYSCSLHFVGLACYELSRQSDGCLVELITPDVLDHRHVMRRIELVNVEVPSDNPLEYILSH